MSEKKRKSQSTSQEKSRKRAAVESSSGVLKIRTVPADGLFKPVIASSPGLALPSNTKFQTYSNGSEVELHSSTHPTIDFIGAEDTKADRAHLKHYVAVYDPASEILELVESKKVTIRGQVRERPKPEEEKDEADVAAAAANAASNYASRAALTETFGTKKSKSAVKSLAENRLLAQAGDGDDESNPLSNALLSTMPTEDLPNGNADIVQENKPLPKANLTAGVPDAVYPLASLCFPSVNAVDEIDISDWQEAASATPPQEIQTRSRFVAKRVEGYAIASLTNNPDTVRKSRLLRYLLILIELSTLISAKGSHSRKVLPTPKLLQKFSSPKPPIKLLEGLRRHFVPQDNEMRSFETQLLHTTICALTLHLPSRRLMDKPPHHFAAEPSEIRDDLAVDDKTIKQYYRELGCRLDALTESDALAWGIKKNKKKKGSAEGDALTGGKDVRLAKLRLPLSFPKRGGGAPGRGR